MRGEMVVLLLMTAFLAGCAGDDGGPAPVQAPPACAGEFCGQGALDDGTGRDLRTHLVAQDKLNAPEWKVGDVFEQHMFFGADDRVGRHIQTIVVAKDGAGYTVATSDETAARWEAVYDYPVLGHVGKNLEVTAFGSDWSWMYQFPLTQGSEWTGSVTELINWNSYNFTSFDLRMSASYDKEIDTPKGAFPGFWIEAKTGDGDLLARYNYVPAIGWFSHFWMYDVETPEPDDIMFRAMSMGAWTNYTGVYYIGEEETVLEDFWGVFPDPSGPMEGQPTPKDFSVGSDRVALMGIVVPIAAGGRTSVQLIDPTGENHGFTYQQLSLQGSGFTVHFVDLPPLAGPWQVRYLASAAVMGAFVWLVQVEMTTAEM